MKSKQSSFTEHYLLIKVEGFKQQEIISQCIKRDITLRNIRVKNNVEMELKIKSDDFTEFKAIAKNRYKITILSEGGYIRILSQILHNKARICGILVLILMVYYQTLFISEIRIDGYEGFTEREIRECLKAGGLFEGCKKGFDSDKIKLHVYDKLGNVSFVSIHQKGCFAEVTIVEGTINLPKVDKSKPCDIIAAKEGYVYGVIPIEGMRTVDTGTYVKKGDVVISGIIPMKSTAYGQPGSERTEAFVHAEGSVTAKIPYRFIYNQSRYETVKKQTGNFFYTLNVRLGDKSFSTEDWYNPYEVSETKQIKKTEGIRPFPFSVVLSRVNEVTLESRKRTMEEIQKEVDKLIRQDIKEKLPEKAQILNKSLYFVTKKNIIEVVAMIESLQEIGTEQEIVVGEHINRNEDASNQ